MENKKLIYPVCPENISDRGLEWFPVFWNQIRINDSIICFLLPFDMEKHIAFRNKWVILKQVSWSMEDGRTEKDHLKLCFHFFSKRT